MPLVLLHRFHVIHLTGPVIEAAVQKWPLLGSSASRHLLRATGQEVLLHVLPSTVKAARKASCDSRKKLFWESGKEQKGPKASDINKVCLYPVHLRPTEILVDCHGGDGECWPTDHQDARRVSLGIQPPMLFRFHGALSEGESPVWSHRLFPLFRGRLFAGRLPAIHRAPFWFCRATAEHSE